MGIKRIYLPSKAEVTDYAAMLAFTEIERQIWPDLPLDFQQTTRSLLLASTTFYVRPDGSDSNTGLVNTAGGAFLTIPKAVDTISDKLDLSIYDVTIRVAAGTYTGTVELKTLVGAGKVIFLGDTTTPGNVIVNVTGGNCFGSANAFQGRYQIKGFELRTTTSGFGVQLQGGAAVVDMFEFTLGACATSGLLASWGAEITLNANWTWNGSIGGRVLWASGSGARIRKTVSQTVTVSGTPNCSVFAQGEELALIKVNDLTFSGSATGKRYDAAGNGAVITNGGGENFLPGNVAGTKSNGGIYI